MSTLTIIRHGQAKYTSDEPELSELGHKQAERLGTWLAKHELGFDAIYHGPRLRQIDTAKGMIRAAAEHGMKYPQPTELADFDEYHAAAIFKASTPRLVGDPEFQTLVSDGPPSTDPADRKAAQRRFQRFFTKAVELWLGGELEGDKVESFPAFFARVRRGLDHVMATEGRNKRVAIVTSAGPVSVSLGYALALPDPTTLKMSSVVWNTSMTEHKYRHGEITLVGFNAVPHLHPNEVT